MISRRNTLKLGLGLALLGAGNAIAADEAPP